MLNRQIIMARTEGSPVMAIPDVLAPFVDLIPAATERFWSASFLELLAPNDGEVVVHVADPAAQPHKTTELTSGDPSSRALTLAGPNDIVVCEPVDENYLQFLRTVGLGTEAILGLDRLEKKDSLTLELLRNPSRLSAILDKQNKKALVVPYYSGSAEDSLAKELGGELYGCREELVQKFFDKEQFKLLCERLSIPTVAGQAFDRSELDPDGLIRDGVKLARELLATHGQIIIRGTSGSAGSSLHICSSSDLEQTLRSAVKTQQRRFLVEPLLPSKCSPNDQWAIGRNGEIVHIGTSRQIFDRGLRHIGNISLLGINHDELQQIQSISRAIVLEMASQGYKGVIGIDYIATPRGVFPVENNARFNGSTYAYSVLERLGLRHTRGVRWYMTKVQSSVRHCSDALKNLGVNLYDCQHKAGVIPTDVSRVCTHGTLDLLIVGQSSTQLIKILKNLLKAGFIVDYRRKNAPLANSNSMFFPQSNSLEGVAV
jgi:hypothetical protein